MKTPEMIELDNAIEKVILVPANLLPDSIKCKNGYRQLSAIKRIAKIKDETESKHKKEKREKASRIESYKVNVELGQEIESIVDEDRLYRRQLAFIKVMIELNVLQSDDFE